MTKEEYYKQFPVISLLQIGQGKGSGIASMPYIRYDKYLDLIETLKWISEADDLQIIKTVSTVVLATHNEPSLLYPFDRKCVDLLVAWEKEQDDKMELED